ncbi:hypothetical protein Bxe_A4507 [Paraburkholderia xenovorans LB400]|uniref:Uncharacterized protein n=1 Tax=Paraburkholderia xenovorans (strain LB400) TaxID=266265 RepID=Q144X8_PARXL|nr:hypothetical protein Bxe_A4507 [Paraburkholderia xenovorans LB400]
MNSAGRRDFHMEPILLQNLLNKSTRKGPFQEPYSGPVSARSGLFSRHEQQKRFATDCLLSNIKIKNKAKIQMHHKSTAPQTHLDIFLRICPSCDRSYGLCLLTVIVFKPSLLHVPADTEHSRVTRHD